MNFFNTLSSRLVSRGVNTNSLTYINKSNVSLTLDISGTLVTDYNDISYGSTAYGLRNAGFLIVRDSNGDYLQASDMVQSPFQGFSVYMKYKIRDVMNPNVLNLYGTPNPNVSLYTSHNTIQQGTSLQITVFQTGYVNLPYTISGVTSADLSGASLSGSLSDIYTVLSYDIQPSIQSGTMYFVAGDSSLNIVIQQTSIVGFNAHDLSMAYSQYLFLPYLTDSGVGGSTITYSVTAPDSTTATVTEDFVNIDQSGSYTVVATKSGDGIYPDVSATCHVSLTTSATDLDHLTSMPYFSVSRVHEDDTHRYFLSNFWPSFDGFFDYSYGFPQDPIPRGFYEKFVSLKLPKTPSYPTTPNTCQSYYSEFGDSTEISYNQLHDLQQQGTPGILGRMTTPNVHWSENNLPLEMVLLDPLPAACGGKYLYGTTVDIYVDSGSGSPPYYHFYLDASGTIELSNKTLDIDKKYKFRRLNNSTNHQFYISDQGESSVSTSKIHLIGNGSETSGIRGHETFVLYFNGLTTSDTLTYFCTQYPSTMNATFNLESNGPETIDISNGQSDLMTATDCFSSWDTKYITPDSNYRNFTDSDVSGIYYRPGYYFKYFLDGIQNDTWTELQMDDYGGHIQPDVTIAVSGENQLYGDWHAHTSSQLFGSTDYSNCVIGYGVDGTPIMGGGSTVYNVSGDVLGIASPSWRRRVYPGEYDLSWSQYGNGFYIYDYLHDSTVSGANLDEFNGAYAHLDGVATYAYFITQTYPIWPRNIRGAVNSIKYDETSNMIQYSVSLNSPPGEDPYYIFTDADGNNGTPTLQLGKTYRFTRTGPNHPFNIGSGWKENNTGIVVTSTGTSDPVNGANSIIHTEHLTFTVPSDFSGTLNYFSYSSSNMIKAFVIA